MTFDKITEDGRVWAARYDEEADNALFQLLDNWSDTSWLYQFFSKNRSDLEAFYHISDIGQAINDTLDDSERIEDFLLDLDEKDSLEGFFHPLENFRTAEMLLGKEKGRLKSSARHSSWLRIYAIKLESDCYVITGGAIKLTLKMNERPHTLAELSKLEKVRNYLLGEGIVDDDSFMEFVNT